MRSQKNIQIERPALTGCLCMLLLLAGGASLAHHSPAVFDRSREVTLSGTVTDFRWGMPHSWIHLEVINDAGDAEDWVVEMDPATHLRRGGWTARTIEPGDEVEVTVFPLRNDEKGGQYISAKLSDGRVMDEG